MPDTKISISERTDESLVRTIAEWMGWIKPRCHFVGWERHSGGGHGLTMWETTDGPYHWFKPHESADDRERVMLAMGNASFRIRSHLTKAYPANTEEHTVDIYQYFNGKLLCRHRSIAHTLGRAFCEAVVMWIEAQE